MVYYWEEWVEEFEPIENNLDDNASYDGMMWETYGEEIQKIINYPAENIWTVFDDYSIQAGYHLVNRMGYFITKKPWTKENTFVYEEGDLISKDRACEMTYEYVKAHFEPDENIINLDNIKEFFE